MNHDLTVKELYDELYNLIEQGYGDFKVLVSYDSGFVATPIMKKAPKVNKQPMKKYSSVILEGY